MFSGSIIGLIVGLIGTALMALLFYDFLEIPMVILVRLFRKFLMIASGIIQYDNSNASNGTFYNRGGNLSRIETYCY